MHKRLTSTERIFLAQRLSIYLRSGIPLMHALDLVAECMRPAHAAPFADVMERVRAGSPLSSALAAHPRLFPALYCQIIAAGEAGGGLSRSLERVAALLLRRQELVRSCAAALAYPAVVCLGTVGITSLLLLYAFPKVIPLFAGMHVPLPRTTRILISFSNFIAGHAFGIGGLAAALPAIFALSYRKPRARAILERIALGTPFIGTVLQGFILSSLFRTIAELLESGVSLPTAISLARESIPNAPYRATLARMEKSVLRGMPLSAGMRSFPARYPSLAVQLIEVGERTGTLPESARTVSGFFEEQLERDLAAMSAALEPALLLVTGCIVGFVALAVISPMYQITQSFSL